MNLNDRDFQSEFIFQYSRSGGPGGQNVNKVSSKAELRFNIENSIALTPEEKHLIMEKLVGKINNSGELIIVSQSERSQIMNKEKTIKKFFKLIEKVLLPRKKRVSTKPTKASIEKRLDEKKVRGLLKSIRRDALL